MSDVAKLRQLAWWRWSAFALGCAAFFLSFFHRLSTGAIAADLQREFAIGATALGTLGATYFYIYALMQVPAGVLADTLGPRVTLSAGVAIAGAGSLAFGLAGGFAMAALARTLIGFGVSVVFVCTLKLHANWFAAHRFATAAGVANVAGIAGAFSATAPLAWLVTVMAWRHVFVALGIASLVLAAGIWRFVRDAPVRGGGRVAVHTWRSALSQVIANPATWPPFWVFFGVGGVYMTFVGLWAAPFLIHVHNMGAIEASGYPALSLIAFACCVPLVGWLSDRLRVRRPIVIGCAVAYTLSGVVWIALPATGGYGTAAAAIFTGLAAPGFSLAWSVAKEVNRPERAGMAIAVANIGGFVAAGILQPLVGWIVDHGAGLVAGGSADAYRLGMGVLAAWSVVGIVAATRLTETRCHSVCDESETLAHADMR